MPNILALSDGWTIALAVINLTFSLTVGLGMFWLKSKFAEISNLRAELKTSTEQLINERFSTTNASIDAIHKRLEQGDAEFRSNLDRDHKLELKTLQTVEAIRRDMATRAELERINTKLAQHDADIAMLKQQRGAA